MNVLPPVIGLAAQGADRRSPGKIRSSRLCPTLRGLALAGLLLLPVPDRLAACAFHTALPEASLSEDIAASVAVIAARPSAIDPFAFETVAVLRGEASGDRPPYIVDSVTRARLARNPDEAVLFARGPDGTWTRLFLLDAATRPLVDLLMARADVWATPAGAEERRDVFAALLAHPDERVRRIALRELDALPYDVLRGGTYPVPAADLLRGLSDIDELPFAPIRILLLGLDGSESAHDGIAARLAFMGTVGVDLNLGAWITAAVESGGPDGVAQVERLVLAPPDRLTPPELTQVVRALSVLSAEGDPALRASLDGAIRRLVSRRPDAGTLIAQAFGATADFSQVELIGELVAARVFTDRHDLMAAAAYVSRSSVPAGAGANAARPGQAASLR
jgi:hypothetical protein